MNKGANAYFAITYYQIVYAILHSQYTNKKSKLFVATDYLNMSQELLEKLQTSSFFEEVIFFKEKEIKDEVFSFLENEKDFKSAGQGLKERINKYYENFINLDPDDTICVFNIKQLFYGYIYYLPNKMVLIEDGYRSIKQQIKIHEFKGRYRLLEKFEGDYFPETNIEDKKFEKFIINNIDDIKDLKLNLDIEEYNYVKMINSLSEDKLEELLAIFEMNKKHFDEGEQVTLVLTQPLARAQYCNPIEQFLVYKRLVEELKSDNNKIIIKLHPADKNIYSCLESDNVEIIETPYPVDLILFKNDNIKKVISYGSTATDIMGDKVECSKIFAKENFVHKDVVSHIRKYIKNTRINILVSGQCKVSDEVIKKANYHNPYIIIAKHNTTSINDTKEYALANDFDYFIYDEIGTNYNVNFFNQLYKAMRRTIVSIYSFSNIYIYNGREYLQESIVYNQNLKFSFYDKLVRSNIQLLNDRITTIQSFILNQELLAYLIKTKITADYYKAEKLFINEINAKKLVAEYQKNDLDDHLKMKLIQNININVIGSKLICVHPDKLESLQEYIDSLPTEQLSELLYLISFNFMNTKTAPIKGLKYVKITPDKVIRKGLKTIFRKN